MTHEPLPRPQPQWSGEVEEGYWITERLHPLGTDVGSVVPDCFPAYARILHPLWREDRGRRERLHWSDLADRTGIGPTTQPEDLPEIRGVSRPMPGTLDCDGLRALIDILRQHTRTPERCWIGIWEGFGWIGDADSVSTLERGSNPSEVSRPSWTLDPNELPPKRLHIPGRSLILYMGVIEEAAAFCNGPPWQSPNLWWPADRAWCVGTDIDAFSSYVGGSEALVRELLTTDQIEAIRIDSTAPIG